MQHVKSPFILPILHNNTHHGTFRGRGGLTYKWYVKSTFITFVNDIIHKIQI